MNKLKVMTIVGTRPEIIRLSEIIKKMDKYFNHILVHTGQNWDYSINQIFFEDLELRVPDFYLNSVGKNLGETIGNIIAKSFDLLLRERPDALLILGDTNSSLSRDRSTITSNCSSNFFFNFKESSNTKSYSKFYLE